ncbi:MAG TPA: hypothetical protein VND65_20015 [Candidatus Binatia bacterium]|nr:hypothetical protein [Candidatus Binatia bacterium]
MANIQTASRSETLRDTNRRLDAYLENIPAADAAPPLTPERMAALLSELLRAGAELRSGPLPPLGTDPQLDAELAAYRRNVERLHRLLPYIHRQLLTERTRLEAQRARLRSASQWLRTSRQTL